MLVKKIKFTDYDGNKREEEHYFNLNKSELIKLLVSTGGDYTLDKAFEKIYKERNGKEIMDTFENLIRMSYGKKSLDGRKFEKNDEIWNDFYQTEAYDILFTELVTNAKAAAEFINGIIPKNLSNEVADMIKKDPNSIPPEVRDAILNSVKENADSIISMPGAKS